MGNKDEDWTVDYEATGERYKRSLEHWKGGDRKCFGLANLSELVWRQKLRA